jgi:hypothetical protein
MAIRPTILVLGFAVSFWNCSAHELSRVPASEHDTGDPAQPSLRGGRTRRANAENLRHLQNRLDQLSQYDAAQPPSGEAQLSPATVTGRKVQTPDITGYADAPQEAAGGDEHPIMSSGIQPPAPPSSQDESGFAAQAQERAEEEVRIAAILKTIAELELKMAEIGPPNASAQGGATAGNSREAARQRIAIATAYAQQAAAYNRQLAASRARAAALYDFVGKPGSVGRRRMLEIEQQMAVSNDPRYFDPNMPVIIAEMVAKEMRVAQKFAPAPIQTDSVPELGSSKVGH